MEHQYCAIDVQAEGIISEDYVTCKYLNVLYIESRNSQFRL